MSEYKRLTTHNDKGNERMECKNCAGINDGTGCTNKKCYTQLYNRLAELEDKIENDTLIGLPCVLEFYPYRSEKMKSTPIYQLVYENVGGGIITEIYWDKATAEARQKEIKGAKS